MKMKRIAKDVDCKHQWEDIYVFRSADGKKLMQQKCKKCQKTQYVNYEETESTK